MQPGWVFSLTNKEWQPLPDWQAMRSFMKTTCNKIAYPALALCFIYFAVSTWLIAEFLDRYTELNQRFDFERWKQTRRTFCEGQYSVYDGLFAKFNDVIIDPYKGVGKAGGEDIDSVMNQSDESEFYQFKYGLFTVSCKTTTDTNAFHGSNHLHKWREVLLFEPPTTNVIPKQEDVFTIAITRYEYVNFYHTMTDFYNAFIIMKFFQKSPEQTKILFIDGHPFGGLDGIWKVLFKNVSRIGWMKQPTQYKELVWGILGYDSPVYTPSSINVPLVSEFRDFFLQRLDVNDHKKLTCEHLSILFVWRRDYVAHPRNPTGHVSRKISNEKELVHSVRTMYPEHNITESQIDLLSISDQLKMITKTDILIGMHGAGLTHAFFLPQHAALVEIYPQYWSSYYTPFEAIARWRHLHYQTWQNVESKNEIGDGLTYVPPHRVLNMISTVLGEMC